MIKYPALLILFLMTLSVKGQTAPCDSSIHVPNTVTPNGDSANDCLYVSFSGKVPAQYRLSIYNRWGEKVYDSSDPYACWDASCNKSPCPEGVYVWMMKYRFAAAEGERTCAGSVTIVR